LTELAGFAALFILRTVPREHRLACVFQRGADVEERMKDIENEADVRQLVDAFYARIQQDALLSPIFSDVAQVDWAQHLPKMYAFWNQLILGISGYAGAPFAAHVSLPVTREHFERWLQLFREAVDAHFAGPGAARAKNAAASIAHTFALRMGLADATSGPLL
jgi:hemoglobin